jgi:hypothetical protein
VVAGIGAAAVAYFLTGKDCGCHVQTLNKTTAFYWWQAVLEVSRLWRGSKHPLIQHSQTLSVINLLFVVNGVANLLFQCYYV